MDKLIASLRSVRFRGKYRLMSLLGPSDGVRSARVFGYQMDLDLSDWIQRNMYFGSYEQPQTSQILSHLSPGMTFVDVGANVGYYTAMASSIVGGGRVIAYEPNPWAFDRLNAWIAANQAKNITTVCAALGSREGSMAADFGNSDSDNHTASLVTAPVPNGKSEENIIDVRTLDAEAKRMGIRRIDVMKIDVDGYETEVFNGASELLAEGRIGAILCEFSVHWLKEVGSSADQLERFFTSRGFAQRGVYGTELLGDRWYVRP